MIEQSQERGSLLRRALLSLGLFVSMLVVLVPSAKAYDLVEYSGFLQPGDIKYSPGGPGLPVTGVMAAYYGSGNTTVCAGIDSSAPYIDWKTCGVNYAGNARNAMHFWGDGLRYALIQNGGSTAHTIHGITALQYDKMGWSYKQTMTAGQKIESPNQAYRFTMQSDGNAVVYNNASGKACWSTQTNGRPGSYIYMQPDGNLVVYPAGVGMGGSPYWYASGTWGNNYAYLQMQNDGNLVIYGNGGAAVWATSWLTGQIGC